MFRNLSKIRTVLSAGFLLAAVFGFGEAKAETEYLNNAQLTLLFSGNALFSEGGVCKSSDGGLGEGSSTWDFDLKKDGSIEMIFNCHITVPFEERSSGNWRIEGNKLCMEDKDGLISRYSSNDKCWAVKPGAGFFEVYNSNSEKIWEFVVYSHKPNLPDGFGKQLAELKKLDGAQVAGKQSEPKVDEGAVRRQAAELNRRLATLEKREREVTARRQAAEMVVASPADAKYLNNAQLTLLFSGNALFSDGGVCGAGASLGSSTWDFDLNKDGSLEIIFACHKSYSFEERSSGNWRIEGNKLCMEDKDGLISRYSSNDKCWAVKPGAGFFEVYNSNSEKIWEFVVYSHKPNLPDGFGKQLAELKKLDGAQVAGKQSEPKVDEGTVRRQAAELNRRLATLEKREREDAARRQAAEMERKKETEKKRSLAAKETVYKKPPGASSALKERLAALKNLKETGLLSEEQFQAKTNAVLNEFLGLKGSSTTASKGAPGKKALSRKYADVNFGNYHALVIGANDYKYLPNLKTAINDAKVVAEILRDNYGFKVKLILNPTRGDILNALDDFREKLGSEDNLLIYYAGHGYLDEEAGRGYWLPVDAKPNRRYGWVSNGTLTDTLKTLQAKHVMIVADSCYSGTLTRGVKVGVRSGDYYKRMAKKWTRVALVSGGLEPVADSAGGGHSPFAKAFINALKGNVDVIDGTQLFSQLRRPVTVSTQQTPEYSDVRNAGHDGGDFLFVRTK